MLGNVPAETAPSLADVLRARGLRLTAQRQLVLEAVQRLGHATPEQVHQAVCKTAAGVNITTIYRALELLEGLGLVAHTHLSHGAPTYHVAGERSHLHLVCHRCGAVEEAPLELMRPLADRLRAERGFVLDIGHVAMFGTCARCAESQGTDPVGDDNP
jgi:Fur family transcriptional regulator, ferric uptake regulator